jgi:hypothetical protein
MYFKKARSFIFVVRLLFVVLVCTIPIFLLVCTIPIFLLVTATHTASCEQKDTNQAKGENEKKRIGGASETAESHGHFHKNSQNAGDFFLPERCAHSNAGRVEIKQKNHVFLSQKGSRLCCSHAIPLQRFLSTASRKKTIHKHAQACVRALCVCACVCVCVCVCHRLCIIATPSTATQQSGPYT